MHHIIELSKLGTEKFKNRFYDKIEYKKEDGTIDYTY